MVAETWRMEEAAPGSSLPHQSHKVIEGAWPHASQEQELAGLLEVPTAHFTCPILLCSCGFQLSLLPTMFPGRSRHAGKGLETHGSMGFPWRWRASWAPLKPDCALAAQGVGVLRSVQADGCWCHAQCHQWVPVWAAVLWACRRVNVLGVLPVPPACMQGLGDPGSRAAEDPKPVPCLGTLCQGVHPASWYLSDLPCLFQLLLLQWLLDSPGAEATPCPLPVLQDEGSVAAAAWYKPAWCAPEFITAA